MSGVADEGGPSADDSPADEEDQPADAGSQPPSGNPDETASDGEGG